MYPAALRFSAAIAWVVDGLEITAIGAAVVVDGSTTKNCWIDPRLLLPFESWNAPGRNSTVTTQEVAPFGQEVGKPPTVIEYVLGNPGTAVGVPNVRFESGWPPMSICTSAPVP